ncbi:MAG: CotH kinase family protein [Clostridia bacterium]|nr:CotH kinase family protein [Clostridia bacterium]
MFKKVSALFMAVIMTFSLVAFAACNGGNTGSSSTPSTGSTSDSPDSSSGGTGDTPEEPAEDWEGLPAVYITTEGGLSIDDSSLIIPDEHKGLFGEVPVYDYVNANISVSLNDEMRMENVQAEVKVRGNYTSTYEKRPIRIKFDKKQSMCGLNDGEKYKNWVLLAEYRDSSMLRNSVSFYLGNTLLEGEGVYASDFCYTEVYINGQYNGLYVLCEQQEVKEGRVELPEAEDPEDYDEDNLSAEDYAKLHNVKIGYFIEYDGYYQQEAELERFSMQYLADLNGNVGNGWQNNTPVRLLNGNQLNPSNYNITPGFTIKSDVYFAEQRDFIQKCTQTIWNVVLNATHGTHTNLTTQPYYTMDADGNYVADPTITSAYEAVSKVIDVDSLITMYILQELFADSDLAWSSFLFSIDMSENGSHRLVYTAPWDFDSAMGLSTSASSNSTFYAMNTNNPWLVVFARQAWFWDLVQEKWAEAKAEGVFSGMIQLIDDCTATYVDAYARNFARWPNSIGSIIQNSSQVNAVTQFRTQADASTYLKNWLSARLTNLEALINQQAAV